MEMYVNASEELNGELKKELQNILWQHANIFTDIPGQTDFVQYEVEITDRDPVKVKPYQMTYTLKDLFKQEVEVLLKAGIIKLSRTVYS